MSNLLAPADSVQPIYQNYMYSVLIVDNFIINI